MSAVEENIKRINNKLQNLLKQLNNLQKENSQLHELVRELKTKNEEDQLLMTQLAQQVAILKSAAGQLTEEEKKSFERNINQYLREIDKCIGMLSE